VTARPVVHNTIEGHKLVDMALSIHIYVVRLNLVMGFQILGV